MIAFAHAFALGLAAGVVAGIVVGANLARAEMRRRAMEQYKEDTAEPPATEYLNGHIEHFEARRRARLRLVGKAS